MRIISTTSIACLLVNPRAVNAMHNIRGNYPFLWMMTFECGGEADGEHEIRRDLGLLNFVPAFHGFNLSGERRARARAFASAAGINNRFRRPFVTKAQSTIDILSRGW
jgi:hypothetical protein